MNFQFTNDMLVGKTEAHVVPLLSPFATQHKLHPLVLNAFQGLQQSAVNAGFDLQPASSFRGFERQLFIWNSKMQGTRKVHDDEGIEIDILTLNEWDRCQAILRWSALPGASRHHWGTEIDVFAPNCLPKDQTLQLEPWEYCDGGYFNELRLWLLEHLPHFDFYLPFNDSTASVGYEPWHISYRPLAEQASIRFTPEILLQSWRNESLLGKETLFNNIDLIFTRFILQN